MSSPFSTQFGFSPSRLLGYSRKELQTFVRFPELLEWKTIKANVTNKLLVEHLQQFVEEWKGKQQHSHTPTQSEQHETEEDIIERTQQQVAEKQDKGEGLAQQQEIAVPQAEENKENTENAAAKEIERKENNTEPVQQQTPLQASGPQENRISEHQLVEESAAVEQEQQKLAPLPISARKIYKARRSTRGQIQNLQNPSSTESTAEMSSSATIVTDSVASSAAPSSSSAIQDSLSASTFSSSSVGRMSANTYETLMSELNERVALNFAANPPAPVTVESLFSSSSSTAANDSTNTFEQFDRIHQKQHAKEESIVDFYQRKQQTQQKAKGNKQAIAGKGAKPAIIADQKRKRTAATSAAAHQQEKENQLHASNQSSAHHGQLQSVKRQKVEASAIQCSNVEEKKSESADSGVLFSRALVTQRMLGVATPARMLHKNKSFATASTRKANYSNKTNHGGITARSRTEPMHQDAQREQITSNNSTTATNAIVPATATSFVTKRPAAPTQTKTQVPVPTKPAPKTTNFAKKPQPAATSSISTTSTIVQHHPTVTTSSDTAADSSSSALAEADKPSLHGPSFRARAPLKSVQLSASGKKDRMERFVSDKKKRNQKDFWDRRERAMNAGRTQTVGQLLAMSAAV